MTTENGSEKYSESALRQHVLTALAKQVQDFCVSSAAVSLRAPTEIIQSLLVRPEQVRKYLDRAEKIEDAVKKSPRTKNQPIGYWIDMVIADIG